MKIKKMFEKLEDYNDIAKLTKNPLMKIHFSIDGYMEDSFSSFEEFKKYCKEEFFDCFTKAMMKAEYKFNATTVVSYIDAIGELKETEITFEI